MSCAQCRGVEQQFDRRFVKLESWKHRILGPPRTTKRLIAMLCADGMCSRSLLDVGGGLGAIQLAFAEEGAPRIEVVDAAPAYLAAARERAERLGYADRATFRPGDFVELAAEVEPVDVVTLDRVICCYDDVRSLLEASAAKCRVLLGLVYPRDRGLMRAARRAINLFSKWKGSSFAFFVHDEAMVRETVAAAGLRLHRQERSLTWNVEVYRRG